MKKNYAVVLGLVAAMALAGCAQGDTKSTTEAPKETTAAPDPTQEQTKASETEEPTQEPTEEPTQEPTTEEPADENVMSYSEYMAAAIDDPVVIEAFVQGKQSWWDNKATLYLQDEDGAYFVYNAACSEDDYKLIETGTRVRVEGYKAEWSGEIEIADGTVAGIYNDMLFEANPVDVTDLLGKDELIDYQNRKVSFTGMTIEPIADKDGNEAAFLYNWDGSGTEGNDLYFKVSYEGNTYTFTVESYLTGPGTKVYDAVRELEIGDKVDLTGFLYWYNGVNPHITDVEKAGEASGDVMSYEEYVAAEADDPVTIEAYVQAKQSWWDDKATVYLQDRDGAYFAYNMACDEETYALLAEGTKIRVEGFKSEWAGEVEIVDATFEIIADDTFVADPVDVTALLDTEELIDYMNRKVTFTDMTVEAIKDKDGNEAAFLYNWDGSGTEGNDLYFNVSKDGKTYTFTVESYLTGSGTDVYEAVKAFKVGDTVDLAGFLYWYNGVNPHITSATVK